MSGIDVKHTTANSVRGWAEDLNIFLRIVGDGSAVLLVVCISVKSNTNYPGFEVCWKLRDSVENNSRSLTGDSY